jgi:prepilin-type N-terminal cleavage/methylation domain-containing protein
MTPDISEGGFSLVEVMAAMIISGIALVGSLGAVQLASRQTQEGVTADRALTMAQGRLEAMRSVRWDSMLEGDLNQDGVPDVVMKDDGEGSDVRAGDGVYSAGLERDGIRLVWTLEPDRSGPLGGVGSVTIVVAASYQGPRGLREVRLGTARANPLYVGAR